VTKNEKQRHIRGIILRWVIPLGISAIAFFLIFRKLPFSEIVLNIKRINFQIFALATVAFIVSYVFRAACWYILLQRKVAFRDVFFTMGAGYLLNNIFPFRLGEIGRAVMLDDPQGPSALEALSTILIERIFDVFIAAVCVLSMLPRVFGEGFDQAIFFIALGLTTGGLFLLYLAVRFQNAITSWLRRCGEKRRFISTWVEPKVSKTLEGLKILNNWKAFTLAFLCLATSWLIAFGEHFIVFRSLYPKPQFWWMIFILGVGAFGSAIPAAPSGLGVFEGAIVGAFALLGVDAGIAFTHAIVIHVIFFIYSSLIGLIGLRLRGEAAAAFFDRVLNRSTTIRTAG